VQQYGSCAITHYFTTSEIITKLEVYVVLQCSGKDGCDMAGHSLGQVGRPQKQWISTNKRIFITNVSMTGFARARDPGRAVP